MNILSLILLCAFFIVGGVAVQHTAAVSTAARDHPRVVCACTGGRIGAESGAPLSNEVMARCWRVAAQTHMDRGAAAPELRAMTRADQRIHLVLVAPART